MATDFKDLPVNLAGRAVYATSASFGESIGLETLKSYGVRSSAGSFNTKAVEASASATFYLTNSADLTTFTALTRSNSAQQINIGGNVSSSAYLTDLSINTASNSIIQVSTSWIYFGSSSSSAATAPVGTIEPAIAQKTTITGYDSLGGGASTEVGSFDYSLSQSYNAYYYLGKTTAPAIIWGEGEASASIEAYALTDTLLNGVSPCPTIEDNITIAFANCDGTSMGSISLQGYSVERGWDINSNEVGSSSVNLTKFL